MPNYSPFLADFFNSIIDIVRDDKTEVYAPVDYYPLFKSMRESLFQKHSINLDTIDEKTLLEQLPKPIKLTLDELELAHQNFVDVVFLKKTTLQEKPLVEYIKNIHNNDNWITGLYHFQDFLNKKDYAIDDFKEQLLTCFESMKEGQRFELLSNVAVFIEAYGQTHEGKAFLENDFTLENPQSSFRELFRRMNNASVFNAVTVKNDKKGNLQCQYKSGGGGEFDGLYIFPDDKGGLMVRQVQISATSDMGTGIEENSVFRHAISNVIIAKSLDESFKKRNNTHFYLNELDEHEVDESLTEPFKISPNDYQDEKIDILQEQKQKALLTIMKEYYSGSFGDAQTFKDLIKDLNANLHDYIYLCFGEKPPLKSYAVEDTIKDLHYVNVSNVFVAKTAYQPNEEYERSTLGEMLGKSVDLNMKEFRHGLQLVALSTFNTDNCGNTLFLQNEGLKIAFSGIVSRCVDNAGEVDATKLNKLGQKAFEKILFDNFILSNETELQRNFDVLNRRAVKDAFKFYLSRIILRDQDDISFYDQKLIDLELETNQTLKETCKKFLNINFLDRGGDLENQIKEKYKRIEAEDKRIEAEDKNLINKGLRKLHSSEEIFEKFAIESNLKEIDIISIRKLKTMGFDGEDKEAKINNIKSIKSKLYIDEIEYPNIKPDSAMSKKEGDCLQTKYKSSKKRI